MPATRPPEFRRRALDLVAQGNPVGQVAKDLGISESCLRCWMSIDDVERWPQRGVFRVLEVAPSTYYEAIKRQPSALEVEDQNLTGWIVEVDYDCRGIHGAPRVHAELRLGLGLRVGHKRVARLMRNAGIHGVSNRR